MEGVLYLNLLIDAARHFADPRKKLSANYRWLNRKNAARGVIRYFRKFDGSLYRRLPTVDERNLNDEQAQAVLVFLSNQSYRNRQLSNLKYRLDLMPEGERQKLAQADSLSEAFLRLDKQQEYLQNQGGGGDVNQTQIKVEQNHNNFTDYFLQGSGRGSDSRGEEIFKGAGGRVVENSKAESVPVVTEGVKPPETPVSGTVTPPPALHLPVISSMAGVVGGMRVRLMQVPVIRKIVLDAGFLVSKLIRFSVNNWGPRAIEGIVDSTRTSLAGGGENINVGGAGGGDSSGGENGRGGAIPAPGPSEGGKGGAGVPANAARLLRGLGGKAALAIPGLGQAGLVVGTVGFFSKYGKWIIAGVVGFLILFLTSFDSIKKTQPLLMFPPGEASYLPDGGGRGIGGSCPTQEKIDANKASPESCRYLNPGIDLFDSSLSQESIDRYVQKYSSIFINAKKGSLEEFNSRVNYIVNNSRREGLNPALFLGYWKTESNFSTVGGRDMGCGGDDFYEQVDCALGINLFNDPAKNPIANCAKSKDATSVACVTLKAIRNQPLLDGSNPIRYPIATIDDFAEAYGSRAPELDGAGKVNNNCVSTYNKLLEVGMELGVCRESGFAGIEPPFMCQTSEQCHDELLSKFGVDMGVEFPLQYLQWAWEKLWNVSNTKFLQLVKGGNNIVRIRPQDSGKIYNEQSGCPELKFRLTDSRGGTYSEALFKVVLIHELAHIIQNCNAQNSGFGKLGENVPSREGYLTSYSQNSLACAVTRTENINEDYAEAVTYYLNPEFPEQDIGLCPSFRPQDNLNPYDREGTSIHKQIMAEVLGGEVSPPTGLAKFSCPVVGGGRNRGPSYQKDPVDGHCGSNYKSRLISENGVSASELSGSECGPESRRAKSMDVDTCINSGDPSTCFRNGKDVVLPTIDGKSVGWQYIGQIALRKVDCFNEELGDPNGLGGGCGTGYVFNTRLSGGEGWALHLLHMAPSSIQLSQGQSYSSGTVIGKTEAVHVHISIGKNVDPMSRIGDGWYSVDTQLQVCE